MSRHSLRIALFTFVFGFTLVTSAAIGWAENEPPTPSVDDAVSTLLAQTQQAPTQIFVTQTVQAALEQALTATAQPTAQAATPIPFEPIDISTISATMTETDLIAGPGRRSAHLAPDGERFIHFENTTLCLYEGLVETRCVDTADYDLRIDSETIRWSLDSRYIAFTEDFFRLLSDPDIWLWDTTTDTLNNLTDDGTTSSILRSEDPGDVDLLPTWLPDGTPSGALTFLRYPISSGDNPVFPLEIYTIAPDGSDLTHVGTLDVQDRWSIYSMSAYGERLMYVYAAANADNPNNGIWVSDADGSNFEQIVAPVKGSFIRTADAVPGGEYILFHDPASYVTGEQNPDLSVMKLVNIETGEISLINPDLFVVAAGWSLDGSLLAYTVIDRENEENNGLYITNTPGEPGRMILEGEFIIPTSRQEVPIVWGENNTLLLSQRDANFNLVLVELGSEAP